MNRFIRLGFGVIVLFFLISISAKISFADVSPTPIISPVTKITLTQLKGSMDGLAAVLLKSQVHSNQIEIF